jgi:hypothetical protein
MMPIEEAWRHFPPPEFANYAAGSDGPTSRHELLETVTILAHGRSARKSYAYCVRYYAYCVKVSLLCHYLRYSDRRREP